MNLTVHRGTNEIGAPCVELISRDTRLFIDVGSPLDDSPASLPPGIENADAILISHSHQDHWGLLEQLPPGVPVHISDVARSLVRAVGIFVPGKEPLRHNFRPLEAGVTKIIGEFKVTPYLADHSAPDAFSFLVQAKGKSVFYSGDFRAHGHKAKAFDYLMRNLPSDVDAMLLEGTMFGRDNLAYPTENDVAQGMTVALKDSPDTLALLVCSGQNIDRLVSAFNAARATGRILVIDMYTAWILEEVHLAHDSIPTMRRPEIRVLDQGGQAGHHYPTMKQEGGALFQFAKAIYNDNGGHTIGYDEIKTSPGSYMVKTTLPAEVLSKTGQSTCTVFYSMWGGYLKKKNGKRYGALQNNKNIRFLQIHTSGHATRETLQTLVRTLQPRRVIPIHTEHKEAYVDHFPHVVVLNDGESLEL